MNYNNIDIEISAGMPSQMLHSLPQIALSGRSNVGKSTLVNLLTGRKKLARVSGAPGKTITINYYNIDEKLHLVDLPGYGYAKRSDAEQAKWSELVEAYFQDKYSLRLVIQLIDLKVGPTTDDRQMLEWLNYTGVPYVVAATKADKLNKTQREVNMRELRSCELIKKGTVIIPCSSQTGEGKKELVSLLEDIVLQK